MSMYLSPLQRFVKFVLDIGVYVETGFLELLSTATCAENAYKPALLRYNPTLAAYMAGADPMQGALTIDPVNSPYFSGETIVDGSESKAVGCVEKLATINPCGTEYTAGGYCDGAAILKKKRAQHFMPASVFSGKLRLMIQAIYGSKRTDYEVPVDANGVPIAYNVLNIGSTVLSSQFSPSWGLFTGPDYQYWLVKVDSAVTYYPLILSATAQSILNIIAANPGLGADVIKRAECYALSTATIDTVNTLSSGSISITGTPLYYGLHWKWDGSEARVVCHNTDSVNRRYDARYYKLQITLDSNSGAFSHTITLLENNYWWTATVGVVVIKPFPAENKMSQLMPVPDNFGAYNGMPSYGSFDAAIHCYIDDDNAFQTVRVTNATQNLTNSVNYSNGGNPGPDFGGCFDDLLWHQKTLTYGGMNGSMSITTATQSLSIEFYKTTQEIIRYTELGQEFIQNVTVAAETSSDTSTIICGGLSLRDYLVSTGYFHLSGSIAYGNRSGGPFTHTFSNGQTYSDCYNTYGFTIRQYKRIVTYSQAQNGKTRTGAVLLEIPYGSCSGLYIGKHQNYAAYSDSYGHATSTANYPSQIVVWNMIVSDQGVIREVTSHTLDGNFLYISNTTDYSISFNPANTNNSAVDYYVYDCISDSIYMNVSSSQPSNYRYFQIDFIYPILDLPDYVKNTTSGYYQYKTNYPAAVEFYDAGGYKNDSAVGWV